MTTVIGEVDELNISSESICEFYAQHWQRKIALTVPAFYRWQFTESPFHAGVDHCVVAIDDVSRELLGVMGINKRPFFLDGQMRNGAELTTWIVNPQHAGAGIGTRIIRAIQPKYDVIIGMGASPMALPIYMRHGFRFLRAIPRYVKVFNFDAVEKFARYDSRARDLVNQWSQLGNVQFSAQAANNEFLHLLEPVLHSKFNHFTRAPEYLDWRFSRHPLLKYRQFKVHAPGCAQSRGAYVCLKEEFGIDGLRLVHVMDCFGDDKDLPAAVGFIHNYCAENDIHLADFFCTTTHITCHFAASGWFSTSDDASFQFPHLFHPLEFREPPTTSLVYWSNSSPPGLSDTARLYITKQDVDLDRPTQAAHEVLHVTQ